MSFLEARDRGLPYGGIPYQELLNKLEETDMNDSVEDLQHNYNNYIRSEIIDRSLDKPFLESDNTRRDGSISKSIINLRYNGSRGEYECPQHPELFCGFMDQDNRGLDNNPRMDQYQQQIATRMPNLEIRMGHNCTDNDHESPWTNQSIGQCRRDIQTSLAYNTKVFTDERDGRALNRNFVVEYDHNKKPLIYKDILPSGINGITENESGKTNIQYTTSAVPFVSTDTNFMNSYNNNYSNKLIPGQKDCQKYIEKDQLLKQEYISNINRYYPLHQESKLKNENYDQIYKDHENNFTNHNMLPGTKYIADNINVEIDIKNNINTETLIAKTPLINNITNPNLLNNDISFNESNIVNNKKNDLMRYSNANTFIHTDLYPNDITLNEENNRHLNLYGNNNNITLLNSSYYIPEFKFKHIEIAKHAHFPDNQNIITKTNYDVIYGNQDESIIKTNNYKFNDNINKIMIYNIANVPDTTNETQLRNVGIAQQEHKMKTISSEEVWNTSDENIVGKMQKQSRNGGIEPVIIEIKDSHDIEITNGGSIIGKKSIRGDKLTQEVSETENIYDDY